MAHSESNPWVASRASKESQRHDKSGHSHFRPIQPLSGDGNRENENEDVLCESSPLLSPVPSEHEHLTGGGSRAPSGLLDWNEGDEERSKSVWYLFLLTLSIGG